MRSRKFHPRPVIMGNHITPATSLSPLSQAKNPFGYVQVITGDHLEILYSSLASRFSLIKLYLILAVPPGQPPGVSSLAITDEAGNAITVVSATDLVVALGPRRHARVARLNAFGGAKLKRYWPRCHPRAVVIRRIRARTHQTALYYQSSWTG